MVSFDQSGFGKASRGTSLEFFWVLCIFMAFKKLETAGLSYDCHAQLNGLIDHLVLNGR